MSKNRLEAFSDGVMAIIITIMAFNIELPKEVDATTVLELLRTVGIFFVSFVIVGTQWLKHHRLFNICGKITNKILWHNMFYLFFLCLLPPFTRWLIEHTSSVIAALCYDIVFIMVSFTFHILQNQALKDSNHEAVKKIRNYRSRSKYDWVVFLIIAVAVIGILVLSLVLPSISVICFIVLPIISSAVMLARDEKVGA